MTRIISLGAVILAAALLVTASTRVFAQITTTHKTTYLTFSGPVQIPGATLPPGTYLFRIANPAAQTVWEVRDAKQRHVLSQFFFVPTGNRTVQEINRADGKPVVRFHETPQGITPALKLLYYPFDSAGYVFVYPKSQAEQLAAITHQPVLATDSDPGKSPLAHVMTIQPATATAPDAAEPGK